MITCHWVYYYPLSCRLTLKSFLPMKHVLCFIVGPSSDVGFEMDLEVDVTVWCSDIVPVMLEN